MVLLSLSAMRRSSVVTLRCVRHIHTIRGSTPQTLRALGPARTRFAPSPTGYLHLGSLRTALYNYLVAKATGGQFVLRLEDTDQKRTVSDAEERLYEDLEWAGIEFDEGPTKGGPYGSYKQSERTEIYRKHSGQLLESGNAYRCFCTTERLHTLAEHKSKLGLPPDYDRACAHIPKEESDDRASKGESHVVRLKVPEKYPVFDDLVYGLRRQRKDPRIENLKQVSFDDPILMKSDGYPTYHLANVVDDHLMKITHVIRGTEWMSSTPKHLAMYEAFGWTPPAFAHVGLLVDSNKQKLSKRTGSVDIRSYREQGLFPETLVNFAALLGWSHYEEKDVMSMEDLIRNFSLKFTKGDTVVSPTKLWFLQRRHAARYASLPPDTPQPLEELALKPLLKGLQASAASQKAKCYARLDPKDREEYARSLLMIDISNYTTPVEFIRRNMYFFDTPSIDEIRGTFCSFKLHNSPLPKPQPLSPALLLSSINEKLTSIPEEDWNTTAIKEKIEELVTEKTSAGMEELVQRDTEGKLDPELAFRKAWKRVWLGVLRWALVAGMKGPDTTETVRILGRSETLGRLKTASEVAEGREGDKI